MINGSGGGVQQRRNMTNMHVYMYGETSVHIYVNTNRKPALNAKGTDKEVAANAFNFLNPEKTREMFNVLNQ